MSARSRTSNPVSLFPFLAVLMCTMGALILILIVTSRRIRKEAVARSTVVRSDKPVRSDQQVRSDRLQPVSRGVPPRPAEAGHYEPIVEPPAVDPTLPALRPVVTSPAETDRVVSEFHASIRRENAARNAKVARLRSELAAIDAQQKALSRTLSDALDRQRRSRGEFARLQASRDSLTKSATADANRFAKLHADLRKQATEINGIRRKLALLKLQQAKTSSEYAVVPFDGSTGTTRRPIFIECTDKSLRFLPEGVEITATDLLGFTPDDNPLLAGTMTLLKHWSAKAQASGNPNAPEPYVLLLVRPSGSVAYYAARKMLRNVNHALGYELIEADWDLHLPPADPQATAACAEAVNRSRKRQHPVIASLLPDAGTSATGGRGNARIMQFNRATGRFEVVRRETEPPLGPFGGVVDGDSRNATGRASVAGRGGPPAGNTFDPRSSGTPGSNAGRPTGTGRRNAEFGVRSADSKPNNPQSSIPNLQSDAGSGRNAESGLRSADSRSSNPQSAFPNPQSAGDLWPLNKGSRPGSPGGTADAGANGNSANGGESRPAATGGTAAKDGNPERLKSKPPEWTPAGNGGRSSSQSQSSAATPGLGLFGSSGGRSDRASRQQHRWGFSSPNATIGFEREIPIAVTTDRLIVKDRQTIRVGNGETKEDLLKRVAVAVEREVRSWGKPPDSFYWVPTLRFVISPGGNRHYERLAGSVKRLGLQAIAEHRLETPAAPATEAR